MRRKRGASGGGGGGGGGGGARGNKNVRGRYGRNGNGSSGVVEKNGPAGRIVGNSTGKKGKGGFEQDKLGKTPQLSFGNKDNYSSVKIPTNSSKQSGSRFDILSDDAGVMLTDDELLANNNSSGSSSHKEKVALNEITNCVGISDNNVTRKIVQGSRKNIKKKDKMTTVYGQVNSMPFTKKGNSNYKSSNNYLKPVSKIVEGEIIDIANVLRQLHTDVKDFEAQFTENVEVAQAVNQSDLTTSAPCVDRSFDVVASELKEALIVISE
ncbi:hypothetical protein LWI29_009106 [Acer saccharum]|uniref:Uncharacterized protein n=1 Tax=Acer saccharum TaxID=4024 RepID=A0AA39TD04_ACESA|nr:hypothetical protein LWI29_009106 [Acer saccharum]